MFPCWWKILPADDCVQHFHVKVCGSLLEMPQRPIRYAIRARCLADLEPLDGLLDVGGFG
jgi:hypothetical protein